MSSFSVNFRARVTEPRSGETITVSSVPTPNLPAIYGMSTEEPSILSTGMSKKPWICAACRSMVSTRSAPAAVIRLATSLAEIGSRALLLRSCRA